MSKKIQEKKTKKPDPKAAGERALNQRKIAMEEEALRIRRIVSKMLEPVRERLTALESRSAPAEEWKPKVGDWVVITNAHSFQGWNNGDLFQVQATEPDGDIYAPKVGGSINELCFPRHRVRPATEAEIASHKAKEEQRAKEAAWAKFDVLQVQDACHVAPHEAAELLCLAKPIKGLMRHDYSPLPEWAKLATFDDGNCFGFGSVPDTYDTSKHWTVVSFAEFLRRLQGTIAKRAEDERTKELAKPLEFGTRVSFRETDEEKEGRIASELDPSGYIISYRVPDGRWFTIRKKRHEFTIID